MALSYTETSLLLDAPQCAFGQFARGMGNSHPARFRRMLELNVRAFLADLFPSIGFKGCSGMILLLT